MPLPLAQWSCYSDPESGDQIQYRPLQTLATSIAYAPWFGWYASGKLLAVGKQYCYSHGTPVRKAHLAPYATVGTTIGYHFRGPFRRAEAYRRVSNLFDRSYEESYGLRIQL